MCFLNRNTPFLLKVSYILHVTSDKTCRLREEGLFFSKYRIKLIKQKVRLKFTPKKILYMFAHISMLYPASLRPLTRHRNRYRNSNSSIFLCTSKFSFLSVTVFNSDLNRLKLLVKINTILQTCLLVASIKLSPSLLIFLYILPVIFNIINKFVEVVFPSSQIFIQSWVMFQTSYRQMVFHIFLWFERHCYILTYIFIYVIYMCMNIKKKCMMYVTRETNDFFLYLWEVICL